MYKTIDEDISSIVLESIKRHLWFLTPELVILSLFDKDVSNDEKKAIVAKLFSFETPSVFEIGKPSFDFIKSQIHTDTSLQLSSFIGHQSWFILKRAQDFLKLSNDDETLD